MIAIVVVHAPNSLVSPQPHTGENLPYLRKVTILVNCWIGQDGGEDNLSSQLKDTTVGIFHSYVGSTPALVRT